MELYLLHERRQDYLRKFQKVSTPLFLEGVYSIYANVKRHNKVSKKLLKEFQQSMFDVSLWSKDIISKEYERFQSKVPSINKYIQVVFETDKVLRNGHVKSAVDYIPKPYDFIHQCYLNIARALWKQPFLMYDINVTKLTLQKNKLKVERIVNECIQDTFVQYLPLEPDGDDGLSDYVLVHDDINEINETFSHSSEPHEGDITTYDAHDAHDEDEINETFSHSSEPHESDIIETLSHSSEPHESDVIGYDDKLEHVPDTVPKQLCIPEEIVDHVPAYVPEMLDTISQDAEEYPEATPEEQEECESQHIQEEEFEEKPEQEQEQEQEFGEEYEETVLAEETQQAIEELEDMSAYDISQVPILSDTVANVDTDADNIRIVNVQDGRERTRDTLLSLKKRVKSSIHRHGHTTSKSFF
jgi:hypothetical protein